MAMRLDVFLTEKGFTASRTEAKNFITSGAVKINGTAVTKPSYDVDPDVSDIEIDRSFKKYVSRGGYKLEGALSEFDLNVEGRLAIDIGASSGGFTDCLLQNGASHVIAVDSGSGQLCESLQNDTRVTSLENYNARYMNALDLEYVPNLAVMDVSFISATYIMPAVYNILSDGSDFICLIKPQFEVGKSGIGKGGIVKNEKIRQSAVTKVTEFAKSIGFEVVKVVKSSIEGGDGNIEYLAHLRK